MSKSLFHVKTLVVIATVMSAFLMGWATLENRKSLAMIEIEAAHSEFELALETLSVRMAAIAAVLQTEENLSPRRFSEIYSDFARPSNHVHERALAFMPEFGSDELADLEHQIHTWSGDYKTLKYPDFLISPPHSDGPLLPAILVEPENARQNVFGYNLGSSKPRHEAVLRSKASHTMAISRPVVLSQDGDRQNASFLLICYVSLSPDVTGLPWSGGVLGAGITPATLFAHHQNHNARLLVEVTVEIENVPLSVSLGHPEMEQFFTIPLINELRMPPIETTGFTIPFMASVRYTPKLADFIPTLLTAAAIALIGTLLAHLLESRELHRNKLEEALAQKENVLQRVYDARAESQRLEALGRLVGGVAHDFNNILSIVMGNLELLGEDISQKERSEFTQQALFATQRGAQLTKRLLAVGRKSHLNPESLSPNAVLQDTAAMLERVLPDATTVQSSTQAGIRNVVVDRHELGNALLNLALNARDAMPHGGTLSIRAENASPTKHLSCDELSEGAYVSISVTDTGEGMSAAVQARAFEPFYSTKSLKAGTGLGLPSVLGFCKQSGGTCCITTKLGIGTTITMVLPAAPNDGSEGAPENTRPARVNARKRVLVVEDNANVALVMRHQLEKAGCDIAYAASGDDALALIGEGRIFEAVISDLEMPGAAQGDTVLAAVQSALPDARLILISGHPPKTAEQTGALASKIQVLVKPVSQKDLLASLSI